MVDDQSDHHPDEYALEFHRSRHGCRKPRDRLAVPRRRSVKLRLVNEMDSDHPMHHPFHVHGAGRFIVLARDGATEENLVWKDTVLISNRRDGGYPARRHQPRHLDGALPYRRTSRERNDVQLQRGAVTSMRPPRIPSRPGGVRPVLARPLLDVREHAGCSTQRRDAL